MQSNYVHGCHGQTSSVHHTADVAFQSDVIQVRLPSLDLLLVHLAPVLKAVHFLSELGVVIKLDLTVEAVVVPSRVLGQGVDLQQLYVLLDEQLVHVEE